MTTNCALYVRISDDKTGEGLGVERQRKDCQALADREGWTVVGTYTDNDLSAYSGKPRPQYQRMLADLKGGRVGAVVAWHPDRLYRHPSDLEEFINVVDAAGAAVKTCTAGDLNLSTGSGKMIARMLGAAARGEVDRVIERVHAKKAELRSNGQWQGGGRPFGYRCVKDDADRPGRLVPDEAEAAEVLGGARAVLAGQSTLDVAKDWNERGVTTINGRPWTSSTVARVLARPRNVAIVEHYGCEVGPASWAPIYDEDTYRGGARGAG